MLDFNRANLSDEPISISINDLIETAATREIEEPRHYLAPRSLAPNACDKFNMTGRSIPLTRRACATSSRADTFSKSRPASTWVAAGFRFGPATMLGFRAANGFFRGHADGVLLAGPDLPGVGYPCLWEHKALCAKGWRKLSVTVCCSPIRSTRRR